MPTPPIFAFKITLLENGLKLLHESGIGDMVHKYADDLIAGIEKFKPLDGTAVQEKALLVLSQYVRERPNLVDAVDAYLTANPRFQGDPIEARDLVFVGAVTLRDLYFAKHPEITD